MTDVVAVLIPALALALLHFLWQGALIGLLAWLALTLLRNHRTQTRYAVACFALLTCALLPIMNLVLGLCGTGIAWIPSNTQAITHYATATLGPALPDAGSLATSSPAAFEWIVAFWVAGAALLSLRMLSGILWVHRWCSGANTNADEEWQRCVDRLAQRFGMRRAIVLRIAASGDSPVAVGWWRPLVLLPAALVAGMPADLLEALLAHELAHIRRHDYLINLLQSAVEAILFYHPVVWWLSHRIRVERELVADDLAANVLGERRRLAIALSELDRTASTRSPFLHSTLAQAAHGGQLMSRIQQLLRPQRHRIGSALTLPVLGLLAASAAVYAHAHQQPTPLPAINASPVAAANPSSRPTTRELPSNATLPAPRRTTGPIQQLSMQGVVTIDDRIVRTVATDRSYALVHKGSESMRMSGSMDDIDDIKLARKAIDGDFIWLRRNGKAYVIRDAEGLARIDASLRPTSALDVRMNELSVRMHPHEKEMEALQARMERRQAALETPDMSEPQEGMEAVSRKMQSLGDRQQALAARILSPGATDPALLDRQMQDVHGEQEKLARQMQFYSEKMQVKSREMERLHAPMEAIGLQMQVAARPMEAIGQEMEALGKKIEHEAAIADRSIQKEIDAAVQAGLALPAPHLR